LLRHDLALGPYAPYSSGPAVVGAARAVGALLVVDPAWRDQRPAVPPLGPGAAVLALEGPGVQVVALDVGALPLRRTLDAAVAQLTTVAVSLG
jgi:urease accessory protein